MGCSQRGLLPSPQLSRRDIFVERRAFVTAGSPCAGEDIVGLLRRGYTVGSHQLHAGTEHTHKLLDAGGLRRSSTRLLESQLEQLRSLQESVVRMQGRLEAHEDAETEQRRRLQAELQQLLVL